MKLLITISYYLPNISGLTIYARHLAEELERRDVDTQVLTAKQSKDLKDKEVINGVEVHRAWTPLVLARGPIMPLYPITSLIEVMKVDVVNCHIPQFEAVFPALWAKILGKRVYLTHHCDLTVWPGFLNKIAVAATYLSLLLSGVLANNIIVYTKDYADSSRFLQIFKHKLLYQLPPVKPDKRTKTVNKIGDEKIKIGFAGRIAQEKGLDLLVKTVPSLKKELGEDFMIYLAGPYKEVIGGGKEKELEMLFEKYRQNVVLLGSLDSQEMNYFYQNMDVVVLPSTQNIESFGFVQVEAMLNGCPVVATEMAGVRMPTQLSKMGRTFKKGSVDDLTNALLDVLANKKKYLKKKATIIKSFDWRNNINFYEKLFKGIPG